MISLLAQIENPVIKPRIGESGLSYVLSIGGNPGVFIMQIFLKNFVVLGFVIGSITFLFMLVWGGIEYIIAGGEKEKLGNASKRITNALIGIAILLAIYAISKLVNLIFGINILKLDIPVI